MSEAIKSKIKGYRKLEEKIIKKHNEKIQKIADNMKKYAFFSKKTYNLKEILVIHTQYLTN